MVYLVALGTFLLALAGIDTGSAFGGFGSSREMLVAALTEGGLVLSLLTLALIGKSTNLTVICAGHRLAAAFQLHADHPGVHQLSPSPCWPRPAVIPSIIRPLIWN